MFFDAAPALATRCPSSARARARCSSAAARRRDAAAAQPARPLPARLRRRPATRSAARAATAVARRRRAAGAPELRQPAGRRDARRLEDVPERSATAPTRARRRRAARAPSTVVDLRALRGGGRVGDRARGRRRARRGRARWPRPRRVAPRRAPPHPTPSPAVLLACRRAARRRCGSPARAAAWWRSPPGPGSAYAVVGHTCSREAVPARALRRPPRGQPGRVRRARRGLRDVAAGAAGPLTVFARPTSDGYAYESSGLGAAARLGRGPARRAGARRPDADRGLPGRGRRRRVSRDGAARSSRAPARCCARPARRSPATARSCWPASSRALAPAARGRAGARRPPRSSCPGGGRSKPCSPRRKGVDVAHRTGRRLRPRLRRLARRGRWSRRRRRVRGR